MDNDAQRSDVMTCGFDRLLELRDQVPPERFEAIRQARPDFNAWLREQTPASSAPSPLDDELKRLRGLVYVPGAWRCDKCRFVLMKATLNAYDGSVSPLNDDGGVCPNCSTALRRFTEREAGNDMVDRCEALQTELAALRDADHWRPIATLPDDESMVLAGVPACSTFPDGRVMLWRASILRTALSGGTPMHLQFPATHWKPRPAAPVALDYTVTP